MTSDGLKEQSVRICPSRRAKTRQLEFKQLFNNEYDYRSQLDLVLSMENSNPSKKKCSTHDKSIKIHQTPSFATNKKNLKSVKSNNVAVEATKSSKTVSQESSINDQYQCSKCLKSFKLKSSLNRHMEVHAESPPICVICHFTCSTFHNLRKHVMNMHTEDGKILYQQKRDKGRKKKFEEPASFSNSSVKESPSIQIQLQKPKIPSSQALQVTRPKQPNISVLKKTIQNRVRYACPNRRFVCKLCRHSFQKAEYLRKHTRRVHTVEGREKARLYSIQYWAAKRATTHNYNNKIISSASFYKSEQKLVASSTRQSIEKEKRKDPLVITHNDKVKTEHLKVLPSAVKKQEKSDNIKTKMLGRNFNCQTCEKSYKSKRDVRKHWYRVHDKLGSEKARSYAIQYWTAKRAMCQNYNTKMITNVDESKDNLVSSSRARHSIEKEKRKDPLAITDKEVKKEHLRVTGSPSEVNKREKPVENFSNFNRFESDHTKTKMPGRNFNCQTCGKSFKTKKDVRKHCYRVHDKVGREKARNYFRKRMEQLRGKMYDVESINTSKIDKMMDGPMNDLLNSQSVFNPHHVKKEPIEQYYEIPVEQKPFPSLHHIKLESIKMELEESQSQEQNEQLLPYEYHHVSIEHKIEQDFEIEDCEQEESFFDIDPSQPDDQEQILGIGEEQHDIRNCHSQEKIVQEEQNLNVTIPPKIDKVVTLVKSAAVVGPRVVLLKSGSLPLYLK